MALEPYMDESVPALEFGWEMWLLCSSLSIGFFSLLLLLAYYYVGVEEDGDEELCVTGSYRQLEAHVPRIPFPEREDKFARFRRWARCFRRQPPPARPPVKVCHVEIDVQVALAAFARVLPHPAGSPSPPEGEEGVVSLLLEESRRGDDLRAEIVQFLIDAGPPRSLSAISEESHVDDELPPRPPPSNSPSATPGANSESAREDMAAPVTATAVAAEEGEMVLVRGKQVPLTRDLLWAALALLSRSDAALPPPSPPTSSAGQ